MEINSVAEYNQFKTRRLLTKELVIHINQNAHPDILGEAKFFIDWDQYQSITFEDSIGNSVRVVPVNPRIVAHFIGGENHLTRLPTNCKIYNIKIEGNAKVTDADIDAILKWQFATEIHIIDNTNVSNELFKRIDEMKCMRLQKLTLTIQREYSGIHVNTFFEKFDYLEEVIFVAATNMTRDELNTFANTQVFNAFLDKLVLNNQVVFFEVL